MTPHAIPHSRRISSEIDFYLSDGSPEHEADDLGQEPNFELSESERARADRYRSPDRRRQFQSSRRVLRRLLSSYLNCAPAEVPLASAPSGRPMILVGDTEPFQISVSHVADVTAIAVAAPGAAIGIDVESEIDESALPALINVAASSSERDWIESAPAATRCARLTLLWTIKEAVLKAAGCGAAAAFREVRIHFGGNEMRVAGSAAGFDLASLDVHCLRLSATPTDRPTWGAIAYKASATAPADWRPALAPARTTAQLQDLISNDCPETISSLGLQALPLQPSFRNLRYAPSPTAAEPLGRPRKPLTLRDR
jgi:4'-phosphopantetheinyl transferase